MTVLTLRNIPYGSVQASGRTPHTPRNGNARQKISPAGPALHTRSKRKLPSAQTFQYLITGGPSRDCNLALLAETISVGIFTMSTSELATSYAALILADDDVEVTVSGVGLNPDCQLTRQRPTNSKPLSKQPTLKTSSRYGQHCSQR